MKRYTSDITSHLLYRYDSQSDRFILTDGRDAAHTILFTHSHYEQFRQMSVGVRIDILRNIVNEALYYAQPITQELCEDFKFIHASLHAALIKQYPSLASASTVMQAINTDSSNSDTPTKRAKIDNCQPTIDTSTSFERSSTHLITQATRIDNVHQLANVDEKAFNVENIFPESISEINKELETVGYRLDPVNVNLDSKLYEKYRASILLFLPCIERHRAKHQTNRHLIDPMKDIIARSQHNKNPTWLKPLEWHQHLLNQSNIDGIFKSMSESRYDVTLFPLNSNHRSKPITLEMYDVSQYFDKIEVLLNNTQVFCNVTDHTAFSLKHLKSHVESKHKTDSSTPAYKT